MEKEQVQVAVAGKILACLRLRQVPLVWPEAWDDELEEHGFIDVAVALLSKLPAAALATPWIIGSASKTLFGSERRDSLSHMEGRAFDISPMYSDDVAIQPEGPIMGLAWNLIYIALFSSIQDGTIPFVIEGDHLHVEPSAKGEGVDPGQVFAVMTAPNWYPWTDRALSTEVGQALLPSIWLFDGITCTLEKPSVSLATRLKKYLS